MARKSKGLSGVGPQLSSMPESYDNDKHYEVVLNGVVEYPPGSRRFLNPTQGYVELRGRVANAIADHILTAREVPPRIVQDAMPPTRRTNLTSVKSAAK